jgi:hypothetical protein
MAQPTGGGSLVPGVAVTAGEALTGDRDTTTHSTDDDVPVGAADAHADAARTGASGADDDTMANPGNASVPDLAGDASSTDDGVPVGSADADADRRRTGGDTDSD